MRTNGRIARRVLVGSALLAALVLPLHGVEGKLEGTWLGKLEVGGGELRTVFVISRAEDGSLSAIVRSPDQTPADIPVASVALEEGRLTLLVPIVQGRYEGKLVGGGRLRGEWRQRGVVLPLELERVESVPEPKRPQEPRPPFPYREEPVRFSNTRAEVELAGTLTLPPGDGPFPAVLLISGSGPQNRDEELLGHRPFLVIADYLTRRGIAVLRYDDRGVGESSGSFAVATTAHFASDARAGFYYLQGHPEIDASQVGLIGHSEGGLVAPMVAARAREVAFVVLLAAPGVSGRELLEMQSEAIARAGGASDGDVRRSLALQRRLFDAATAEGDLAERRTRIRDLLEQSLRELSPAERRTLGLPEQPPEQLIAAQTLQLTSAWFRFFLTYDPLPALRHVGCPVLAITGEKDLQVPPRRNLPAIARVLEEAGNGAVTVQELAGLNHLFQTAASGLPAEYGKLEETFAPAALELMGVWIAEQTNVR